MWSDFDGRKGTLSVSRTLHKEKGGRLVAGDTKTYAGTRKILLPSTTAERLAERKKHSYSQWIFPNPLRPEAPLDPSAAYRQMKKILAEAGLPELRFHDLRHTFATASLEHGMHVKTLSTIIGHVSSATTLNTYTHITDAMRQSAADKIDRGISKAEPREQREQAPQKLPPSTFQAHKGQRRKPGTGCVSQINDHLWEGRYSPVVNGRRMARNVYAKTETECEAKLAALIREMKAETAAEKERRRQAERAS